MLQGGVGDRYLALAIAPIEHGSIAGEVVVAAGPDELADGLGAPGFLEPGQRHRANGADVDPGPQREQEARLVHLWQRIAELERADFEGHPVLPTPGNACPGAYPLYMEAAADYAEYVRLRTAEKRARTSIADKAAPVTAMFAGPAEERTTPWSHGKRSAGVPIVTKRQPVPSERRSRCPSLQARSDRRRALSRRQPPPRWRARRRTARARRWPAPRRRWR